MKTLVYGCYAMLFVVPGCTDGTPAKSDAGPDPPPVTRQDLDRKIGEAVEATRDYAAQQQQEYAAAFNEKLKQLDVKIQELEQQGTTVSDEAKAKWAEELALLKAKRQQAGEILAEIQQASGKAWEKLRAGSEAAWADLKQTYDEAASEIE